MRTVNIFALSKSFQAYLNCVESNNVDWQLRHENDMQREFENLPMGSGIDDYFRFEKKESNPQKLIFSFGFHHLNTNGYYDGWTYHRLIITPTFGSFDLRITGRNRNDIKSYLSQLFDSVFIIDTKYRNLIKK